VAPTGEKPLDLGPHYVIFEPRSEAPFQAKILTGLLVTGFYAQIRGLIVAGLGIDCRHWAGDLGADIALAPA
jgi:hypothetical protein